jgi:hypothetical protein
MERKANAAARSALISRPTFHRREWAPLLLPESERNAQRLCDFFNSPLISD